jgi:hypothetical protein
MNYFLKSLALRTAEFGTEPGFLKSNSLVWK